MKIPARLALAQILCRNLPPLVSQSMRTVIYPRRLAYRDNYDFVIKSQTGSLFAGSTSDYHNYTFSVHGYFNWRNWAIMMALCQRGDFIIEVGGNVGTETVGYVDIVGPQGKVMVFEPLPKNIEALQKLSQLNKFENLEIIEAAVGGKTGRQRFVLPPDRHSSGVGYIAQNNNIVASSASIEIACYALDDFNISDKRVAALAIDAEGYEVSILEGATKLISQHRFPIICEASPKLLRRAGKSLRELYEMVVMHNYKVFEIGRLSIYPYQGIDKNRRSDWVCLPFEMVDKRSEISRMFALCSCLPCVVGINPLVRPSS